jgi:hypothetical protein
MPATAGSKKTVVHVTHVGVIYPETIFLCIKGLFTVYSGQTMSNPGMEKG